MSINESVNNLIPVVKSAITIKNFIEGGEVKKMLKVFGDIHTDAALYQLQNISKMKPEDRTIVVKMALNDLTKAHLAYYRGRFKINEPLSWFQYIVFFNCINDQYKDFRVCCLIAIFHAYLNDDITIVHRALVWAACAMKDITIEENGLGNSYLIASRLQRISSVFAGLIGRLFGFVIMINPFFYRYLLFEAKELEKSGIVVMSENDFLEFSENLGFSKSSMEELLLNLKKEISRVAALFPWDYTE
ncbi:MAG: hypothetical protein F6K57_02625 [Moorea sp. SIO4A5]|nr:hypothetical protein [Moorena sp. SIO4A5]